MTKHMVYTPLPSYFRGQKIKRTTNSSRKLILLQIGQNALSPFFFKYLNANTNFPEFDTNISISESLDMSCFSEDIL